MWSPDRRPLEGYKGTNKKFKMIFILQCGDKKSAILAIPGASISFDSSAFFSNDGLTEKVGLMKDFPIISKMFFLSFVLFDVQERKSLKLLLRGALDWYGCT